MIQQKKILIFLINKFCTIKVIFKYCELSSQGHAVIRPIICRLNHVF